MLRTTTPAQLKELSGLERPSAVRRWLKNKRIPFLDGADGWPRVLEVVIIERMGGQVALPAAEPEVILE